MQNWIRSNWRLLAGAGALLLAILFLLSTIRGCTASTTGTSGTGTPVFWRLALLVLIGAAVFSYRTNNERHTLPVVFSLMAVGAGLVILGRIDDFVQWPVFGLPALSFLFFRMAQARPGRSGAFLMATSGAFGIMLVVVVLGKIGIIPDLQTMWDKYIVIKANIIFAFFLLFFGLAIWKRNPLFWLISFICLGFWSYESQVVKEMLTALVPDMVLELWAETRVEFGKLPVGLRWIILAVAILVVWYFLSLFFRDRSATVVVTPVAGTASPVAASPTAGGSGLVGALIALVLIAAILVGGYFALQYAVKPGKVTNSRPMVEYLTPEETGRAVGMLMSQNRNRDLEVLTRLRDKSKNFEDFTSDEEAFLKHLKKEISRNSGRSSDCQDWSRGGVPCSE